MSFLDLFRKAKADRKSVEDPLWGTLTSDRPGWWDAECRFEPTDGTVQLIIQTSASRPTEDQHRTYLELSRRYEHLLPKIGEALFELCGPFLEGSPTGRSKVLLRSPDEMLQHVQLETIWIDTSTFGCSLALSYGFATDGIWDDASMNVGLENWAPRGLGIDD